MSADAPPAEDAERKVMGIDPYERRWMITAIVLLVGFAVTVTVAGFAMGFSLPTVDQQVDPKTVAETAPWDEPGVREISPGVFEAYVIAQTWSFSPRDLVVPVGSEVTFYVTSIDLQHGFKINDTNVNMQIVPGQVSKLVHNFEEVGTFPILCTEYCGKGHAAMFGQVTVLSAKDYAAKQEADQAATDNADQETTG